MLAVSIESAGPAAAFAPWEILGDIRRQRGWDKSGARDWLSGALDHRGNAALLHAAAAPHEEVNRRIWRAQLEVLFPVLEVLRSDLARRYAARMALPARGGAQADFKGMDIGPLVHQLRLLPSASPQDREVAEAMITARNALAHCEPVTYDDALRPALRREAGRCGIPA